MTLPPGYYDLEPDRCTCNVRADLTAAIAGHPVAVCAVHRPERDGDAEGEPVDDLEGALISLASRRGPTVGGVPLGDHITAALANELGASLNDTGSDLPPAA